jgi:hypothetical protein
MIKHDIEIVTKEAQEGNKQDEKISGHKIVNVITKLWDKLSLTNESLW